jgi:hypothetical protein
VEAQRVERRMAAILAADVAGYLRTQPHLRPFGGLKAISAFTATGYVSKTHWRLSNWGTPWNAIDLELSQGPKVLRLRFDTVSAYPYPIFKALAARFPKLHFVCKWRYWDITDDFRGQSEYNAPERVDA